MPLRLSTSNSKISTLESKQGPTYHEGLTSQQLLVAGKLSSQLLCWKRRERNIYGIRSSMPLRLLASQWRSLDTCWPREGHRAQGGCLLSKTSRTARVCTLTSQEAMCPLGFSEGRALTLFPYSDGSERNHRLHFKCGPFQEISLWKCLKMPLRKTLIWENCPKSPSSATSLKEKKKRAFQRDL